MQISQRARADRKFRGTGLPNQWRGPRREMERRLTRTKRTGVSPVLFVADAAGARKFSATPPVSLIRGAGQAAGL